MQKRHDGCLPVRLKPARKPKSDIYKRGKKITLVGDTCERLRILAKETGYSGERYLNLAIIALRREGVNSENWRYVLERAINIAFMGVPLRFEEDL